VASSITLSGRQSKLVVTDYAFGSSRAVYSTAQVFFAGTIDGRDVLFLYGNSTEEHEFGAALTGTPNRFQASPLVRIMATSDTGLQSAEGDFTVVSINKGVEGLVTVYDSDTQLILYADYDTATTFWQPTIASSSSDPFANFWGLGTNESVIIGGPYLVRAAELSGNTLQLRGDLNASEGADGVTLTVIGPKSISEVTWNGQAASVSSTNSTILTASVSLSMTSRSIDIPVLGETGWKFADSLPEIQPDFDDSTWTIANHTETNIPDKPLYGDGRILYGCDYELYVLWQLPYLRPADLLLQSSCENIVLWRGHFNATGDEKSVNLSINGGEGQYPYGFSMFYSLIVHLFSLCRKCLA